MKNLLFLLLLSPVFTWAQNTTINLKVHGLNATLINPDNYEYTVKKSVDVGTTVYSISLNDHKIKVNDLPKPVTTKELMNTYLSMPKTKSKSSTFKILEKKPNSFILEANYSGSIRYTFFYFVASKGKQIMVEGSSDGDLEVCKMLRQIGESFKMD